MEILVSIDRDSATQMKVSGRVTLMRSLVAGWLSISTGFRSLRAKLHLES